MKEYTEWRHVFKLDPNKSIDDDALEAICESGTDGIIVGGTDGVTLDNTIHLMARIRRYQTPCALEVSNVEALTPGFDYYFIPMVLNSKDIDWVIQLHHQAVREYGAIINWKEIAMEGYCILNEESKVAKLTSANTAIEIEDVIAYARMAEHMYKLPIFYLEYSGSFGDMEVVKGVKQVVRNTRLFYGGGITTIEQAKQVSLYADTVIIGNVIYDDLKSALATVKAVKG